MFKLLLCDVNYIKILKNEQFLYQNFIFKPLTYETLGPFSNVMKELINQQGTLLNSTTGVFMAGAYLKQRISLVMQQYIVMLKNK